MVFKGYIGGTSVLILLDFGSNNSFVSSSVAAKLQGVQPLLSPVSVQVADGSAVQCSQEIPSAEWLVQGHTFHSTLKVLDLGYFDMIFGMD